nr:alpha-glucosidase [Lachnospiraceae bacterium]
VGDDMMFKPLSFVYRGDEFAEAVEDQLMVGDSIMIAPVYEPNAIGRYVYLPEDMLAVLFESEDNFSCTEYKKGHHFIKIAANQVVVFIRQNKLLPLCCSAKCTAEQDYSKLRIIGYIRENEKACYTLYDDDGISVNVSPVISEITAEKKNGTVLAESNNADLEINYIN